MNDKLINGSSRHCGDCVNFDRYKDEDEGYGGCDALGYTRHEKDDAEGCEDFEE